MIRVEVIFILGYQNRSQTCILLINANWILVCFHILQHSRLSQH